MQLKKELTLFDLVFYGVGVIVGAGIYVLVGQAAGLAGNSVWLSFVLAAVVATFTGLSYAELSSMYPRDAAEYMFVYSAFRDNTTGFLAGWLTFITATVAGSTVALGFGKYLYSLIGITPIIAGVGLVVFFSVMNFFGIKASLRINVVLTALTVLGLMIIIFIGLPYIGSVDYFSSPAGMAGVVGAATLIFFAYLGFDDIVNVSEEVRNPKKNVPKAIIISIVITTVIYVAVALSAVSVIPWHELGQSGTPLALVASKGLGSSAELLVSVFALFATASTVLIFMLAASRVVFGMSELGVMPKIFSRIHKKRRTPYAAVVLIGVVAAVFMFLGDMKSIALVVDFSAFTIFALVNLSAFALRFSNPNAKREFRIPLAIGRAPVLPLLGFLVSAYMLMHFDMQTVWTVVSILVIGYLFCKFMEAGK